MNLCLLVALFKGVYTQWSSAVRQQKKTKSQVKLGHMNKWKQKSRQRRAGVFTCLHRQSSGRSWMHSNQIHWYKAGCHTVFKHILIKILLHLAQEWNSLLIVCSWTHQTGGGTRLEGKFTKTPQEVSSHWSSLKWAACTSSSSAVTMSGLMAANLVPWNWRRWIYKQETITIRLDFLSDHSTPETPAYITCSAWK